MIDERVVPASMVATPMAESLGQFLDVVTARYKLTASNLANIDTPGYRTRDLDFRAELRRAATEEDEMQGARLGAVSFQPVARAVHGLLERPDGNNVSVERESMLLAESQMKFNLGVQLLKDQFHLISLAINSGGGSTS
ncbi:MAG TPA: flagellar basal body rod protein FlgB [Candidatus Sulfotelmatobacter sp.]|nr:flagellar basal body rod protein FlgB [Candidatus Sulfotelmatobacter sp.]